MGLFDKKPGGTFFGNLIRVVANKASGGLVGTGANRLPADAVTVSNASTALDDKVTALSQQIDNLRSGGQLDLSSVVKLPIVPLQADEGTKKLMVFGFIGVVLLILFTNKRR